jgi:hypothetical protein
MSNNQNLTKFSSSIMTLKEYYMTFLQINEPYLENCNDWGWFIDLDLDSITSVKPKQVIKKKYKSLLTPINEKEYPRIRSMKSIANLQEMNKKTNYFYKVSNVICINLICINLIGIIMVTMVYYCVIY